MAEGKTYGRFSGRGGGSGAYKVMSIAKKMGAQKQAIEDYEAWQIDFNNWLKKKGKARGIGQFIDIASMFLLPQMKAFTPIAAGAKGAGFWDKAFKGALQTGVGMGVGTIGSTIAEHLYGVTGGAPTFTPSGATDPYAREFLEPMKRDISADVRGYESGLDDFLRNRWQMHAMAGFGGPEGILEELTKKFKV